MTTMTVPLRPRTHATCRMLSRVSRGRLCEEVANGPGRIIDAGRLLYTMGQPAESVYLVRRGLVKTSLVSPGGQELTLRIYPSGDILGELCVCTGERREQAETLVRSEVVEIPLVTLLRRIRQDPQAALDFASVVCDHLAAAHEGLRSLAFDPVSERLARALLELADRLGEAGAGVARIGHYITQEELAHMIGARREVVSGLLNRLRTEGLISYTRRGLIEVDREALQAYAESFSQS
jgi:CRP/FNR family transcriptional regulator, cyclic AMP receptor protein